MKRLQRLTAWLVCLGVILAPFESSAGMRLNSDETPAALSLLRSDSHGVVLELSTPSFSIQADKIGSTDIQRISASGLDQGDQAGLPELPTIGKLVAVPPDAQVSLKILVDESQPLVGNYVLPLGPLPAPLAEDHQPGSYQAPVPATKASKELLSQGFFPASPAEIAAEDIWLRDQRMVRVAFSPFQYDPASGQIIWHRVLQIELTFTGSIAGESRVTGTDPIFEPVYRQSVMNYETGLSLRGKAPSLLAPSPTSREASTATRYRIVVDHPGLYRLTYNDLLTAGLPVDQVDPRNLQLTNQGRNVAIQVNGEMDNKFDPEDEILFYGEAFHGDVMAATYASEDDSWRSYNGWQAQLSPEYFERYTDENVYWLWAQTSPGTRMAAPISGSVTSPVVVPQVFTDTVRAEQSHRYWSFHFTNQDPWIWDDIPVTSITTRTYTTTLTGLATGNYTATLQGEMLSNRSSSGSPDHHTRFTLNDDPQILSDQTWDGPIRQPFNAQVDQSLLREGINELHLTALKTAAMIADRITFDWFSIVYARLFQAVGDQLFFEYDEGGQNTEYQISNFSSSQLQVYEISDPLHPQPINSFNVTSSIAALSQNYPSESVPGNVPASTSAVQLAFQANHPGPTRYLALASPAIQAPKSISAYDPPDTFALPYGADYIIIAPSTFITASQSLADYRAAQGLRTVVVDVQDIYNQFNYGIYHPLAIKRFLEYAYQYWDGPAPAYVLLVGDGHWNFKGYSGNTESGSYAYVDLTIYMPPYMAWVDPWQGEVDSSSLLAAIAGADIVPDLSIGRLPVNNVSQLQAAITKTIAYESTPGQAWQQRLLFAADNPDSAGDFDALSEYVISQSTPPDYTVDRVYLDTFPAAQKALAAFTITSTLNLTGTLFMNYIGHASISRWAGEGMLVTTGDPALVNLPAENHIITLANPDRLPVMVSMDCLDGYWNYAVDAWTSLAEEMVRVPGKGAVAAYSPTGLGVASGHDILNRAFYSAIFEGGVQELGPATIDSKAAFVRDRFAL